jgi:pimeloyl-ACP methyl ester carboxylesterase
MEFVMNSVLPDDTRWILVGPSMGSIVAQCYMANYPEKVIGFVNVDGVPYPFVKQRDLFMQASIVYRAMPYIMWTGLFRPFIGQAVAQPKMRWLMSRAFDRRIVTAQLNQSKFFANLALEMRTMMDCCACAESAWGEQSVLRLNPEVLKVSTTLASPRDRNINH